MISLGLTAAEQALFEFSLYNGYQLKITLQVLDLNHAYLADVSTMLQDGQVNYDYNEAVTSSASMTLLDPDQAIGFDTSSPADGALYADRMIRIVYSVYSEWLPKWVDVPIFCGPVTKAKRDDAIVSVECQGKEKLLMKPRLAWTTKTYKKGEKASSVIISFAKLMGETRFDIPSTSRTLSKDKSVKIDTEPWEFLQGIAGDKKLRQLWYDGRGVLRMRDRPTKPVWAFTEPTLTSVPKLDYNHDEIRNTAYVKGATPTGKKQLTAKRYLTSGGSTPTALGRNGTKTYLVEEAEDDAYDTQKEVDGAAEDLLKTVENANVGFDIDSFVIPHLEVGDMFLLSVPDVSMNLMQDQFAIPLKAGAQTNGTIKKISANAARIRRKR
jgi:hypothetical protein